MNILDRIIAVGKYIIHKFWWIGLLLIIYVFIYNPITIHNKNKKFKTADCITIAYTTGEEIGKITKIKYIYYVNNIEYHGKSASGFNIVNTKDGKYLLKYICDNPQDALIYFNKPIEGDTIPAEYLNE